MKRYTIQLFATALVLACSSLAHASSNSITVFPAEGNKQCSDYASNTMILQMGTTAPQAAGVLNGSENPKDADATGESVSYTVTGGNVVGFSASTTPIDYALLKSGRDIAVIIYPSGGVTSDSDMKLIVNNQPLPISAISLCYGLGNVAPPPPPPPAPLTIPSCDALSSMGGLDSVAISCPANGATSIIYNFELDNKQFYNSTGTPVACVCNRPPLVECNPEVPYDPLDLGNGACANPMSNPTGTEVTTHIELNNDPYVCTTVGGIRKCYSY